LPGAGFKQIASYWRKTLTDLVEKPYAFVRQQMAQGKNEPSYLSKLLENNNGNLSTEDDFVAKWSAASLYAGGADTVSQISIILRLYINKPPSLYMLISDVDSIVDELLLSCHDLVSRGPA
jgi:hypothetical protein